MPDTIPATGTLALPAPPDAPPTAPPGDGAGDSAAFSRWQRGLWIGVAGALGFTGLLLLAGVGYTVYQVTQVVSANAGDRYFAYSGMTLLTLVMLRLLAILVGGGMAFAGLIVSFYTHSRATELSGSQGDGATGLKGSLTTSSPGIAAIVVGALVIVGALYATSKFEYKPPLYGRVVDAGSGEAPGTPQTAPSQGANAAAPSLPPSSEVLKNLPVTRP